MWNEAAPDRWRGYRLNHHRRGFARVARRTPRQRRHAAVPRPRSAPLSRDAIRRFVAKHAAAAAQRCPSVAQGALHSHPPRHAAATQLPPAMQTPTTTLRSGRRPLSRIRSPPPIHRATRPDLARDGFPGRRYRSCHPPSQAVCRRGHATTTDVASGKRLFSAVCGAQVGDRRWWRR
jgi:hypothetical protein